MRYFDHAATSPMTDAVAEAMASAQRIVGNPSSIHGAGRAARRVVEESRETIAQRLGARPGEVVFTSGGTEADNLAIKGIWWARHAQDPRRARILVSAIEHHAVLEPAEWMRDAQGAVLETLPVSAHGVLDVASLERAIEHDPASVALVSVMWANNEVGSLQPIDAVVAVAARHGIPVHSDAVQAAGVLPIDFAASGLHAMTVSAHKLGGPVGVGALLLQRDLTPVPVLHGGGQERDVRSGTIAMPLIAGMAAAYRERTDIGRIAALRDRLVAGVLELDLGIALRGHPSDRLPGNAHFTVEGCEGDALLMLLDAAGIAVSTGSACSAGIPQASHVLLAMGLTEPEARGAIRCTLGRTSTEDDVDALLAALPDAVARARRAGLMPR